MNKIDNVDPFFKMVGLGSLFISDELTNKYYWGQIYVKIDISIEQND